MEETTEQPVVHQQESEAPVVETPVESTETTEGLETEQPEVDEDEEIEHEGEKYRIPKKLKDAFLRQADYTQKTQTVAEERKAVEAEKERFTKHVETQRVFMEEVADVRAIDKHLEQFKQLNWEQLTDADPVQAMKLDRQMRQLQTQREQLASSITQKQQAQAFESQRSTEKQLEQARAAVKREIPDWSPELAQKLRQHAVKLGYPEDALNNVMDHRPILLLHKAYQLDQLMAKQTTKPKAEVQEKPVTTIKAVKATATRDPDKMSTEDWMKWRNTNAKRTR